MTVTSNVNLSGPVANPESRADANLRRVARELEATFLDEMLKSAGLGEARAAFGGGIGEEQFASLLRRQHAEAIAEKGGVGLAEHIFNALKERADGSV